MDLCDRRCRQNPSVFVAQEDIPKIYHGVHHDLEDESGRAIAVNGRKSFTDFLYRLIELSVAIRRTASLVYIAS